MRRIPLAAVLFAGIAACCPAMAQTYPAKPVRVILPFAAGGGLDVVLRPLLQKMSESLHQQFVIDVRAGANGIIGTEAAARAAGLDYVHIPVVGRPSGAQVEAMRAAVAGAQGKVLAYCRSGTRSITIWALGSDQPRGTLVQLGAAAGYDLGAILP